VIIVSLSVIMTRWPILAGIQLQWDGTGQTRFSETNGQIGPDSVRPDQIQGDGTPASGEGCSGSLYIMYIIGVSEQRESPPRES
jgi:hypothetical protein